MLGTLHGFDDDRHYGFISIDGGGEIFVHVKEFDRAGMTPEPGMRLRFRAEKDAHGRENAVELCEHL